MADEHTTATTETERITTELQWLGVDVDEAMKQRLHDVVIRQRQEAGIR